MSGLGNKEIMAKNIRHYMTINDKDRTSLCKDLGFSYSTFTDWINANSYPRIDKIEMMANYFGITKSDLVEDKSNLKGQSYYLSKESQEAAQFLYENPKYKVLFDATRKVKPEDIDFVKQMIDKMNGNN